MTIITQEELSAASFVAERKISELVRRCLDNPKFDDHPAPVLVREADKLRSEIMYAVSGWKERVNTNGKPKGRRI